MTIADNVLAVRTKIEHACQQAGRNTEDVTLIAVSKTQPYEIVQEALAAGINHLGENRVEEASLKVPQVAATTLHRPTWHMIGHIQSRKARDLPPLFDVVHSVDSLKVALKLAESTNSIKKLMPLFLEINISGENSKEGIEASQWKQSQTVRETLWQLVSDIQAQEGLEIRGLMTMAPFYDDPQQTRPVFAALRELRNELQASLGLKLPDLSMGMTNDYDVAIEEGSTHVRVGRAIFGERDYN